VAGRCRLDWPGSVTPTGWGILPETFRSPPIERRTLSIPVDAFRASSQARSMMNPLAMALRLMAMSSIRVTDSKVGSIVHAGLEALSAACWIESGLGTVLDAALSFHRVEHSLIRGLNAPAVLIFHQSEATRSSRNSVGTNWGVFLGGP